VLFLEDVSEHPYRLERMLTQLLYAGVLARQKAILLGQFTDFTLTRTTAATSWPAWWQWLRGQLKIPVLTNLPFGHVQTKVVLPVGAKVEMRWRARRHAGVGPSPPLKRARAALFSNPLPMP